MARTLLLTAATAACFAGAGTVSTADTVPAGSQSLYQGPGPRPGPDVLYQPVATAPELTNSGVWNADPILVSGATAYRDGEFLYQDFLYDDHGAAERQGDPLDPRQSNAFSKPDGTYTYPTDRAYANDAADLVEVRVKPLDDSTAFRFTLNTMTSPALIGISLAIGGRPGVTHAFPHGANVVAPADLFLTVHPSGSTLVAELVRAATGATLPGAAPQVSVDTARRQVEVRIAHSQWDPGRSVVRLSAGVGLWDASSGRYLLPQVASSATQPGGSGGAAAPAAFFNVAFRSAEPMPDTAKLVDSALHPAWWRDRLQGTALARGDISTLFADVDFAKLAAGVDDESGVPAAGPLDRILASHTETGQGADFTVSCQASPLHCKEQYQGQLQPYAIDIPHRPVPAAGYGLTLEMHGFMENYNKFSGTRYQREFGERGSGSIVVTPEARGPDGGYDGLAAVDVFEVWADVAAHYHLDSAWAALSGYSEGGIASFRLAEMFPDLFARAHEIVGEDEQPLVYPPSLRNVPMLMWNGSTDEFDPALLYLPSAAALEKLGYQFELDVFTPADHTTFALDDQYAPAAAFLGTATVDRNPHHITYVVEPSHDRDDLGYVADHAYWLSNLAIRSSSPTTVSISGPISPGEVDAVSYGFGVADAPVSAPHLGAGTLTGGNLPYPLAYTRTYRTWGSAPATTPLDRLDLTLTNVSTVTVDVQRADVDCGVDLHVTTDGPVTVTLAGCGETRTFG